MYILNEFVREAGLKVPKCMSTQHPDNVRLPFFAQGGKIGGEDEVKEAYYAFSHLGIDEQMWDCEGKEVDNYVVKKLLSNYESFFRENVLGEDVFLTLRVPNPAVERAEAKILLETLESIPRSFDASSLFYHRDVAPIFEVILPMTQTSHDINRIYHYYKDHIVGRQHTPFPDDITILEWIGRFMPSTINVIPLVEDWNHMINLDQILVPYLADKDLPYQRVFLARSDPAMNYGILGAVIGNKVALMKLDQLGRRLGIQFYPIIGAGSAPFRGNLSPRTVKRFMREYPSAHTFTLQSAFKYDYSLEEVRRAVEELQSHVAEPAHAVDIEGGLDLLEVYGKEYQAQVKELATVINRVAKHVPKRRDRKLHTGLFGYAREVDGIRLPRAISFTAAMYTIGLPPELLGLTSLSKALYHRARAFYLHLEDDLKDALRYYNPDTPYQPPGLREKIEELGISHQTDEAHLEITNQVCQLLKEDRADRLGDLILLAGERRQFLG